MTTYDITIAAVTGSAPSDGFIDPKTLGQYMNETPATVPTTYAQSLAKSRANRRYRHVVFGLQAHTPLEVVSTTVTGGTAIVAPTSITFRVKSSSAVTVADSENEGEMLSGADAIKRVVANALTRTETTALRVIDPTKGTAAGNDVEFARAGIRINTEVIGPLFVSLAAAETGIDVTEV